MWNQESLCKKYSGQPLSMSERTYLIPIFKGMWVTFRHFFQKPYTFQYPEEKRVMPDRFRGRHHLKLDEEGRLRCTSCLSCQFICPANAIHIEPSETRPDEQHLYRREKHPEIFNIDMLRCIFCGLCEQACPEAAIYLEKEYELTEDSREKLIYSKDMLMDKEGGPRKFR